LSERRSILLLCNDNRRQAGNVRDHIRALRRLSRHDVRAFNPILTRPVDLGLDRYDAVAIHYTIVPIIETYLPGWLSGELARFEGLKVQFVQDEYRWIDAVTAKIRELGIGLLFTCLPEAEVPKVYGERTPETRTETTLAGFVPETLVDRCVPSLRERPLDVGYRGRTVPYWLGRLGQDKLEIGKEFSARAGGLGLRYDVAWGENDRLYGEDWIRFLGSCRATLGTESGATIADYDGSVEQRVKDYLAEHPAASFAEVERAVLAPYEGNIDIRVISPRQFEAAALRTALVLFPGSYSGALEPWRHYLPLEKDFSNFEQVVERLRDLPFLEELVGRAHEEIARNERYSIATFVRRFDDLVFEETATRTPGRRASCAWHGQDRPRAHDGLAESAAAGTRVGLRARPEGPGPGTGVGAARRPAQARSAAGCPWRRGKRRCPLRGRGELRPGSPASDVGLEAGRREVVGSEGRARRPAAARRARDRLEPRRDRDLLPGPSLCAARPPGSRRLPRRRRRAQLPRIATARHSHAGPGARGARAAARLTTCRP
jgi:hypothetical protein